MALGESFSRGLAAFNVRAANFMETNKINTYISTLDRDIQNLFKDIGYMTYGAYLEGRSPMENPEMLQRLELVRQKYEEIEKQKGEIERLQREEARIIGGDEAENHYQSGYCPQCGTLINGAVRFCPTCGFQLGN